MVRPGLAELCRVNFHLDIMLLFYTPSVLLMNSPFARLPGLEHIISSSPHLVAPDTRRKETV